MASSALARVSLFLRAAFYTFVLPGTVLALVPSLLVSSGSWPLDLGAYRFAGPPLMALGGCGLLWCVWDFAHRGRGTLAPVDPPRFVVRSGLYTRVRNPMYVSNLVTLIGEAVAFESGAILAWAAFMWVANHLFVVLYEEPTLTDAFDAAYEEYRRSVPRWVPRLTPRKGAVAAMRIDHIGIAVRSLDDALATYKKLWQLEPDHIERGETDKVTEVMLPVGDSHLQLLEPTDEESTVAKFIEKRGEGLHHIAIRVPDIEAALKRLAAQGAELIDTTPRIGGGGHRVAFVHPNTTHGILIELVEASG